MIEFPYVPHWWKHGTKFTKLDKGYTKPDFILGYDTETLKGHIMTMQFSSHIEDKLIECNTDNAMRIFFSYLNQFEGVVIIYGFHLGFDLPVTMRKYVELFGLSDFEFKIGDIKGKVFCSGNWYASFKYPKANILYLDIGAYFDGSLAKVSKSFGLDIGKLEHPKGLGYIDFRKLDKQSKEYKNFGEYALMDSRLCYQMGVKIDDMHSEYDIPQSTSKANFAEKVFRRKFINSGDRLQFTPEIVTRTSELCYHGGKNGYYLETPAQIRECYEYDFNSAYPYSMFTLPSFISGTYEKSNSLIDTSYGVYKYKGTIKECPYGALYDLEFHYFKNCKRDVEGYATSPELIEAIKSKELKLDRLSGYIWKPDSGLDSPLKRFVQFFWEQKNKLEKGSIQYIFAKLVLNSLYGKFVQRNPYKNGKVSISEDGGLDCESSKEIAGGLYHPFIGALICGITRARLHHEEHLLEAIESSTDSVKSKKYHAPYIKNNYLGSMQLEHKFCIECDKDIKKFKGLFARNRLNVLMCQKGHVLKAALHGFWREPQELVRMAETNRNTYEVSRMPMVREAMLHSNKPMFQMYGEDRTLNVDWNKMVKL